MTSAASIDHPRERDFRHNRRLLVSVFNPQEAREAVLGGARIIDSEDPKSALGNIKPQHVMDISDAVLNYKRDLRIQLSTNIGEDQLLFRRSETGAALEKSPYEIAGKAAQAALGVAVSMGTRVHPCNIVKVGLDGMHLDMLRDVLTEVVLTLNRTEQFSHCQVMSVLFAQDLDIWNERKEVEGVRRALVSLREFHPTTKDADGAFDLIKYAKYLTDANGGPLFKEGQRVKLADLKDSRVLPDTVEHPFVAVNELFPHEQFEITDARRTDQQAIKALVDVTADAGADAIMLDTSVLLKVARAGLISTTGHPDLVDFNRHDVNQDGLVRTGILSLEELRFFVDYCHHRGVEANLAGSVQSHQAQQIWRLVPQVDQISTRGGASAVARDPSSSTEGRDIRRDRVIQRTLVGGVLPPEQGGYLCLPDTMRNRPGVLDDVEKLDKKYGLEAYWADRYGSLTRFA